MGIVGFLARSGVRRRLASGVVLAALVALTGGVVLTAWAGARRTSTAYERLEEETNHADVVVAAEGDPASFDPSVAADGPGVVQTGIVDGYAAVEALPDGTFAFTDIAGLLAPRDGVAFRAIDRPILVEGRLPEPDAADELLVNATFRDRGHPLGSTMDLCLFFFGDIADLLEPLFGGTMTDEQWQQFSDACTVHKMRIVGISGVGADDVVVRESSEGDSFLVATPAFGGRAGRPQTFSFVLVDLEPDADVDAFVNTVLDRSRRDAGVQVSATSLRATVVERTVGPYVQALGLFAVIAAIAAAGVLGPAVARWSATAESDRAPLLAAGLRAHQLRVASSLRGAALGGVAALGAAVIAVAASGQFPIGIARGIDPDSGLRLDATVLIVGAAALMAFGAALGAAAPTGTPAPIRRSSRVADGLQARGVAPAVVAGVRAALARESRGAGAIPTAAGVIIAIVAVVSALAYQAGLGRLLDTPSRYGWTWDVTVEGNGDPLPEGVLDALEEEPLITGLTMGQRSSVQLRDGASVQTFAFEPTRGHAYPTILEGQAPQGDAEVALGGQTLDRLNADIGDEISFRGPNGADVRATIVGRTVLPLVAPSQDLSIAEGVLVDGPLFETIGGGDIGLTLIDLAEGATVGDLRAALEERGTGGDAVNIVGPEYTADLRGYDAVRHVPLVLAGLLALLGLGVLAHTIGSSARRRRRELAVLRCLGFVRRDVRTTVRWNALTLVGVSLAVAVPFGIAFGRTLWTAFAGGIGVVDDPITPTLPVLVVVAATLAGSVALAHAPGRRAGRVRPGAALRSE